MPGIFVKHCWCLANANFLLRAPPLEPVVDCQMLNSAQRPVHVYYDHPGAVCFASEVVYSGGAIGYNNTGPKHP
jgi:hypothetical protein